MTYSLDFRRKVLTVREQQGLSCEETAARFQIGMTTVSRWLKRVEARQAGVPRRRKLDKAALAEDVRQYPEAYQHERAARFGVCRKAIWQALKKLGVTYKKNISSSQSGRQRTARLSGKDPGASSSGQNACSH